MIQNGESYTIDSMDICHLQPDDWPRLKALLIASCKESPDAFSACHDENTPDMIFRDFALKWSRGKREIAYLLSDNNRAWGILQGSTENIGHLWVAPEMRGKRYGKKLLSRYFDWAQERHASNIHAFVTEGSDAIGFYQSEGFSLTSVREELRSGSGKIMIRMELSLLSRTA
jgi:GNAT superfamily N-acetyltransferase